MNSDHPNMPDYDTGLSDMDEDGGGTPEADLWFLPGPPEEEPDDLPPGPRAEPADGSLVADWARAEAAQAARLARVAARLGALDDRIARGPEGWRHRLALIEAAELSRVSGDRVGADRLGLWLSMRLSSVQDDTKALARVAWAARRLTGGPGPEAGLAAFLDRRDPEMLEDDAEPFAERSDSWRDLMHSATDLHPITRACMGYHVWSLAGLGPLDDRMEAAVTAARLAASDTPHDGAGLVFAPLVTGGAGRLNAGGPPQARLARWLDGMDTACLTAMRHLDDIDRWASTAAEAMSRLSGRTPPALRKVLTEWPLVSAPMAETLTTASRAAVQRNLAWMEHNGLIQEVTGQGRFRMWRAAVQ